MWLPEWLKDPSAVVARLLSSVSTAENPVSAPSTPALRVVIPTSSREGPDEEDTPAAPPVHSAAFPAPPRMAASAPAPAPVGGVFVPWTLRHLGTVDVLDRLPDYRAASEVAAALTEVVTAEGPVHVDRLATLVARGFGLSRVAGARKEAILRHLPRRLRTDQTEPVIWPVGRDAEEWTGFRRTPEGVDRPFEHVPLREVVNAMAASARASAGMTVNELQREVFAVFGGRRRGRGAAERLDAALALGVRLDRWSSTGSYGSRRTMLRRHGMDEEDPERSKTAERSTTA